MCLLLAIIGIGVLAIGGGGLLADDSSRFGVPEAAISRAPGQLPVQVMIPLFLPFPHRPSTHVKSRRAANTVALRLQTTPVVTQPTAPVLAQSSPTPVPTVGAVMGKVAFSVCADTCDLDEKKSIWVMNADGTGLRKLVDRRLRTELFAGWEAGGVLSLFRRRLCPQHEGRIRRGWRRRWARRWWGYGDGIRRLDRTMGGGLRSVPGRPSGNVSIDVVPPDGMALKDSGCAHDRGGRGVVVVAERHAVGVQHLSGNTCGIYRSASAPGSEAVV